MGASVACPPLKNEETYSVAKTYSTIKAACAGALIFDCFYLLKNGINDCTFMIFRNYIITGLLQKISEMTYEF